MHWTLTHVTKAGVKVAGLQTFCNQWDGVVSLQVGKDANGKSKSVRIWKRPQDDPINEEHILNDF